LKQTVSGPTVINATGPVVHHSPLRKSSSPRRWPAASPCTRQAPTQHEHAAATSTIHAAASSSETAASSSHAATRHTPEHAASTALVTSVDHRPHARALRRQIHCARRLRRWWTTSATPPLPYRMPRSLTLCDTAETPFFKSACVEPPLTAPHAMASLIWSLLSTLRCVVVVSLLPFLHPNVVVCQYQCK
jgi:hypothetical protein